MPFLIINGILSLISIFGGIYFAIQINQKNEQIAELQTKDSKYEKNYEYLKNEIKKEKAVALKMFNTYNPIFKKHKINVLTYIDGNVVEQKPPTFSQKVYDLKRSTQINICHFLWKNNHDWLTYYFWPETGLPFPFVNRFP